MCMSCPMPPVFMPAVAGSGMGIGIGFLVLFVSHMLARQSRAIFDTQAFYMNHAWAGCVVLLAVRHVLFRAAVWAAAYSQREGVKGLIQGGEHED